MNRKVYISGKISGFPDFKKTFDDAEEFLLERGFQTVMNPAKLPPEMNPADYMRICFSMVDSCDIVVMLDNWKDSKGAKLVCDYAIYIGKEVKELSEFTRRNKNE